MILQDLSKKQLQSVQNSTARINIWEGAVRSGKSHSAVIRFLDYIVHGPDGMLIAVGKTNAALKRNFVDPLLEMLGVDVRYYAGKQEVQLYNRTIVLVGANDERAEGKIRGNTYAGAYVDEITLLPESFWITLLARLSVPGAQLFGTTNPDSPFHWLKRNYIDRQETLDLKTFKFIIEDNPSLTQTFKDNLRREFRGLWFQRYIEGKWVLAEGVVYDFFDENLHCMDFSPTTSRYFVCGVDYGTTNPCAFTLVGYDPSSHPNMWIEDEYYWDSREHNRQKTDTEYAEDLLKFLGQRNIKCIVIDPSAASFKAELIKHGVQNLIDANNDVLDGIRTVSKFLSNGTLKICKRCKNLIKEFGTYAWDENSIKLGIDKPLKTNDHLLDASRYVLMTHFKPIYDGSGGMDPEEYRRWKSEQGWF